MHTYGCIPCKCSGSTFSPIPVFPSLDSLLHLLTQQVHPSAELCPLCHTQSKSSRPWVWAFCLLAYFKGLVADLCNCTSKSRARRQ